MTFGEAFSIVLGVLGAGCFGSVLGFIVGVGWTHANFPKEERRGGEGPTLLQPQMWNEEQIRRHLDTAQGRATPSSSPRPYKGPTEAPIPKIAGLED